MSPTIPSLQARWRVWRWILWLGLGALGVSWVWQTVLREQAADELRAVGFVIEENKIWELAREDWHNVFKLQSWRVEPRAYYFGQGRATHLRNLDALVPALRRLHLVTLSINNSALENVDVLGQLPTLKNLGLVTCPALQNLDGLKGLTQLDRIAINGCSVLENLNGLKGLTQLKVLYVFSCPALQNVDGLQGLTHLEYLHVDHCPALLNVDSLKGLTTLKIVQLRYCDRLTAQSITDLNAALPKANVLWDR